MKLLWLGQNGLLFDFDGVKIMVDPYLTDSLSKEDRYFSRKIKVNRKLFKAKPDVIILTNEHLDHADNESIEKLLKHTGKKKRTVILSCESVYNDITTIPAMSYANHIMFEKNSEWTFNNINIRAVPAKTDDKSAFGVIITDFSNSRKYYVAGDTLYNSYVLDNIPNDIYASFLPINGEFGSMNVTDAKRVGQRVKSRFFVPVHFGMFDRIDPKLFDLPNTIIPKPYKIINFDDYESTVPNPYKVETAEVEDEEKDGVGVLLPAFTDNADPSVSEKQNSDNDCSVQNENVESDESTKNIEDTENIKNNEEIKEIPDSSNDFNAEKENEATIIEENKGVDVSVISVSTVKNNSLNGVITDSLADFVETDTNGANNVFAEEDEVANGNDVIEANYFDEANDFVEADNFVEKTDIFEMNEFDKSVVSDDEINDETVDAIQENGEDGKYDDVGDIEFFEDTTDFNAKDSNNSTVNDIIVDDETVENVDNEKSATKNKIMNDSDKIDAYIREIEKFERGETTDFSTIDDK